MISKENIYKKTKATLAKTPFTPAHGCGGFCGGKEKLCGHLDCPFYNLHKLNSTNTLTITEADND